MADLMHLLRAPYYWQTKCGWPAPRMTMVRRALIDQGALTECPACYPSPRPPKDALRERYVPRTGLQRLAP